MHHHNHTASWGKTTSFLFNVIIVLSMLLCQTGFQTMPVQAAPEKAETGAIADSKPASPVALNYLGKITRTGRNIHFDIVAAGNRSELTGIGASHSAGLCGPSLMDYSVYSMCGPDCGMSTSPATQTYTGEPINTRTGVYEYSVEDLSFVTSAGELAFSRDYTSATTARSSTLSPGWTHNQNTHLILPTDPDGEAGSILIQLHSSNFYNFTIDTDGTFTPYYGILASLEYNTDTSTYILTDQEKNVYTFYADGKLLTYTDARGNAWSYTYDPVSGFLTRIDADGSSHYLVLTYAGGKLTQVGDHAGRSVTYHYDANGDTDYVVDVLGHTWTYEYTAHLMTRVAAPGNVTVEQTTYAVDGKAWQQFDGEGNLVVELDTTVDELGFGYTVVTDALGNETSYFFDDRGTITDSYSPTGDYSGTQYDENFRPYRITDGNSNATTLDWSVDGVNLTYLNDGWSTTNLGYIDDNLTSIIDSKLNETKYFYEDATFPTLLTRVENPPVEINGVWTITSTTYEYYQPGNAEDQPAGKLKLLTDALGNQTFYSYAVTGQIASATTGYGTTYSQTTSYVYDEVGNLTDQTQQGITTHTIYDAARRVTSSIRNYDTAHSTNEDGLYNLTTTYTYDIRGNQIAVTGPDNVITRTYYSLTNRPLTVVQNLVGQAIEVETPPARGTSSNQNLRTDYFYDDNGDQIATQDPAGIITRTYYDAAGRTEYTVQNLVGQDIDVTTLPAYDPDFPDRNVRTQLVYDDAGNTIATIDNSGIITRTYYFAVNRPTNVVQNLTGQEISDNFLPERGTGEENILTQTDYDENGNVWITTDPAGVMTQTFYDALNRPVTVVQNISIDYAYGSVIPDRSDPNQPAVENIRTDTYYDLAGNVIATVDPRGIITRTYYDDANRPFAVVQNLEGQGIYDPDLPAYSNENTNVITRLTYDAYGRKETSTDALGHVTKYDYNPLGQLETVTENYLAGQPQNYQDKFNRITTNTYDAAGRLFETTDTLGRVTHSSYDAVGRLISTTRNYLPEQGLNFEDQYNLVTVYSYDRLGNRLTVRDANNHVTWTGYDALNRPVMVTDPNGHATTTAYNASGNVSTVTDALTHATGYDYDDLGRQTTVTDAEGHVTGSVYDAAGNRVQSIDGNGVVTQYEYDGLGRLNAVVENFRPAVTPTVEINVRTEYAYDPNGNRLSILDGNLHSTFFDYDLLNRVWRERDALDHAWQYGYYADGTRSAVLDANGQSTYYFLDEAGRLATIDYQDTGMYVTFTYDAAGRRLTMLDNQGTTAWTYDAADRVISVLDPSGQTVSYDYDPVGNRTGLTYPNLDVVSYEFSPANEMKVVSSAAFGTVNYDYNAVGQLQTVTRPNGISTDYNFLDNGWLEKITHSSSTETLASFQYQYNAAGNRTQAQEFLAGGSETGVPTVVVTVMESSGTPLAGKTVYAFDGSNYSGYSKVTDANGQAAITLPEGDYHFRADVDGTQFWSGTSDHCTVGVCGSVLITVPQAVLVSVQDTGGLPQSGLAVYAFNGTTYSGYHGTTDTAGQLSLRLPVGAYRFRADLNGTQFWSGSVNHCDIPGCTMAAVVVTLPVTVTVQDTGGNPKSGLNVYAFNGSVYTGYSKTTDANGQAVFTLPLGNYRFRADLNYTQFWSGTENHCTLPGCVSASVVVTVPLTVTVQDTDGNPAFSLHVYAFNGNVYTGYNKTTDANGHATFTLPQGSFRFRADLNGTQFWSGTENHCTLPGCESAAVTVTKPVTVTVQDTNGVTLSAISVYAFNGTTYTGYSKTTSTSGQAVFTLPLGSYRFRADVSGTQYWSGTANHCTLPGCESAVVVSGVLATPTPGAMLHGKVAASIKPSDFAQSGSTPVILTVLDTSGDPVAGLNAYAFNGNTYTGISGTTDTSGQVTFSLPVGSYRFRADLNGTQFWSGSENHCTTPGCETAGIVVTIPLTVTVANQAGMPFEGLHVYAFDGSVYTGYNKVTDANGKAVFTLPVGSYRFRADYDGVPFWSGAANHCDLPGCTAVTVTIPGGTGSLVIDYGYDPLGRLTSADYSDDTSYAYTYDAVGNRMTQVVNGTATNYVYDDANRMTIVNGVTYTWDSNGNLVNDGVNAYTYDAANRLTTLTDGTSTSSYIYNGQGDRLSQTVDGVTTNYTLDLNTGLTQVLTDGTNTYLYGLSRLGQESTTIEFFLGDALGSVRQLTDSSGAITLTRSYTPFGEVLSESGAGESVYGYTGEVTDESGLVYLRARYYMPGSERFISKDTWTGDYNQSLSLNHWNYVEGDPINRIDPTGYCYTNPNPLSLGYWIRFFEAPFMKPCSVATPPRPTYRPSTPQPTRTCTPIPLPLLTLNPVYTPFPAGDRESMGLTFYEKLLNQSFNEGGWWHNWNGHGFDMVMFIAIVYNYELTSYLGNPDIVDLVTEAFARRYYQAIKYYGPNGAFWYVGGRQAVQNRYNLSDVDVNSSDWNMKIAYSQAEKIYNNPGVWKNGVQWDEPYDWGNTNFTWDQIANNIPDFAHALEAGNTGDNDTQIKYINGPRHKWYFIVTQGQNVVLCKNRSCVTGLR